MKPRTDRRPPSRRAPRVAAGLACLGIAVGIAAWLGGAFDRDPVPGDARPGAAPAPADVAATDLAAAPREVVTDAAWVPLAGRVTTPDGGPAAGAHVRVVAFPSGAEVWRGTADADGRFACAGAPGTLYQAFVAPADAPRDGTLFPAEVVAGEGTFVASLRVPWTGGVPAPKPPRTVDDSDAAPAVGSGGTISGRIVDEDGRPVPSASVMLHREDFDADGEVRGAVGPLTTVDGGGRFRLATGLPEGEPVSLFVLVRGARASGARIATRVGAADVVLAVTLGSTTIVRCADAAGRHAFVGWREMRGVGSAPGDRAKAEGEPAGPSDDGGHTDVRWMTYMARFDSHGELRLRGLPPGEDVVVFVPAKRPDDRVGWLEGLPVGADVRLELTRGRTIVGRLIDPEPAPAPGRLRSNVKAHHSRFSTIELDAVLTGDRYEVRGVPDGTRWQIVWSVTERRATGGVTRGGAASGTAGDTSCDVTLSPP